MTTDLRAPGGAVNRSRLRELIATIHTRLSRTARWAYDRSPTLAGGSITVEDGVGRELLTLALGRTDSARDPLEKDHWVSVAVALRDGRQPLEAGAERVSLPTDVNACIVLATLLHLRADRGHLRFCSHAGARRAIDRIYADVARRQLGLPG